MHQPEGQPRPSIYYSYRVHPFRRPPEMDGAAEEVPVVVVGWPATVLEELDPHALRAKTRATISVREQVRMTRRTTISPPVDNS